MSLSLWLVWSLLAIVGFPSVLLGLSELGFFPWSQLNCWEEEGDIQTGRVRLTSYKFWFPVEQSIRDSRR